MKTGGLRVPENPEMKSHSHDHRFSVTDQLAFFTAKWLQSGIFQRRLAVKIIVGTGSLAFLAFSTNLTFRSIWQLAVKFGIWHWASKLAVFHVASHSAWYFWSLCTLSKLLPVFGRPFAKRFALCYRTVVLSMSVLSDSVCLSVTFMHCGQTVGRIKMKLGMHVGLGPGHIVLGGDPASPPLKGHSPSPHNFRPIDLLRPNGCMDQDVTWYGGRPRPMRLCVRWGPRSPPQKGGGQKIRPMFIVTKRLDGWSWYLAWW